MDLNHIEESITLSGIAYSSEDEIRFSAQTLGYSEFHFIDNKETDTQAYCCRKGNEVKIVFRGTEFDNLEDWVTNLDCRHKEFAPGLIGHRGFIEDVESVHDEIDSYLDFQGSDFLVSVDGHSQGAGDATIEGAKLLIEGKHPVKRITPVASPRCLEKETAFTLGAEFGPLFYRIVNNNDVVTRVPTRSMGYWHIENENFIYIMENGNIVQEITAWRLFLDRIKGRIEDIGEWGSDGIKDHYWTEYQRLVRSFINNGYEV